MRNIKNIIISVAVVATMTAVLASCGGNDTVDGDGKNTDMNGGVGTVTTLADSDGDVNGTDESRKTDDKKASDTDKKHDGTDGILGTDTVE